MDGHCFGRFVYRFADAVLEETAEGILATAATEGAGMLPWATVEFIVDRTFDLNGIGIYNSPTNNYMDTCKDADKAQISRAERSYVSICCKWKARCTSVYAIGPRFTHSLLHGHY
eukprot:scaffold395700_cov17-Prasinocladus_malaysianus.AAC.1